MSKFLKRISELTGKPKTPEQVDDEQRRKDKIETDVKAGDKDPQKRRIAQKIQKKRDDLERSLDEDQGDLPPAPGQEPAGAPEPAIAPEPAPPEPMTTEGEAFHIDLARKALFVDLDGVSLTDTEREIITRDVEPENAKGVAKVIRKIVGDYGLNPESFDSRIDSLIEDLKKNERVVVLVPGSFKPPHKGHYEMVRQYSETYPQGHVHVLISAPSAKSERRTKDGKLITPAAAKQIFELYVQPLSNVTVSISEFPSPVTAAYESLRTLEPGTTVALGASRKDNDWKRWTHAQPWAEKEGLGLNILDPAQTAVNVTTDASGRPYSAGNIRDNFDNFELIQQDIPDHVNPDAIKQVFDSL